MQAKDRLTPEQNLLTLEWRRIAGRLLNALSLYADPVIYALQDPATDAATFEVAYGAFFDAALKDLAARRNAAEGERGLLTWEVAISLMAESEILRRVLWDGRARFAQGEPHHAFRMLTRRALSTMRWPQLAESPEQLKCWQRLDRISREFAGRTADPLKGFSSRCTREHLDALLVHLREEHAQDHGMPRKMVTLENFFYRFCADCEGGAKVEIEDADAELGAAQIGAWDIDSLPGADLRLDYLRDCMRALTSTDRDVLYTALKEPIPESNIVYPTVDFFCRARNISRGQFSRIRGAAMQKLSHCVKHKEENAI